MELHELGLVGIADALRRGEVSPVEATAHFLNRIAALDAGLGAFVEVTADRALAAAAALGAPPDEAAPLWGVPLAEKDLTARAGVRTRYGSRAFAEHVPETSDPLADALDGLGVVSLGKTNTPEFGLTGYTESLVAPPARNPWDRTTGAGGSSGGAAVAVAAGLLPAAPASDGGGSIRIPAATVGVVGLKPSRGRLPVGSGMDAPGGLAVAGPIARSVADAAALLDALTGSVPYTYATRAPGHGPFLAAATREPGRMRIGVTTATPWDGWTDTTLSPAARGAYERAIGLLGGHRDIECLDWRPRGYPEMFTTIWRASAARIPVADDELDALTEPLTAWLVREGRALPAERVLGAYQAATVFERETIQAFAPFDAILTPALAMDPQPIGWFTDGTDPEQNFERQCRYAPHTSFVNVAGLPAVTVPVATEGRPMSVQLIGRPGGEATILSLAAELEAARGPLPWPEIA